MFIFITLFFIVGIICGVGGSMVYNQFMGSQTVAIVTVKPDEADAITKQLTYMESPQTLLNQPNVEVKYVKVPRGSVRG